jgi:hypothetical protein
MKTRPVKVRPTLSARQMQDTVAASGWSRLEFAERMGCGQSQIFKYQREGLPPRMNPEVRERILRLAKQLGTDKTQDE